MCGGTQINGLWVSNTTSICIPAALLSTGENVGVGLICELQVKDVGKLVAENGP